VQFEGSDDGPVVAVEGTVQVLGLVAGDAEMVCGAAEVRKGGEIGRRELAA